MDLQKLEDRFDQLAAKTEGVDRCCTYAPWLFSAWEAFSPEAPPFIYEGEEGIAALMRVQIDEQRWLLVPLEYAWRLGAPLVGPAPEALLEAVYRALESYRAAGFLGCLISGYAERSPWANALASYAPSGLQSAGFLEPRGRHIASLRGGFEGFMGRRSAKFRSELRRGDRRMRAQGIEAELHQKPLSEEQLSNLFFRFIQVEQQSWKGQLSLGIDQPPMRDFYRRLLKRVNHKGELRAVFLKRDGVDLAYAFGAAIGKRFRGYQLSQVEKFRPLMLGNMAQYLLIQSLCEEGLEVYDLGMEMAYKHRWAEELSFTHEWFLP